MRDQPMTTIVGNTLGRIGVKVWPRGAANSWDMGFTLSGDEALKLADELRAAVDLGPRVACAADLGIVSVNPTGAELEAALVASRDAT